MVSNIPEKTFSRRAKGLRRDVFSEPYNTICQYAHLHSMSYITTKFHEILLSCFRGVALTKKMDRSKTLCLRDPLCGV